MTEVRRAPTEQEIADVAAQQHNLLPPGGPAPASHRPIDASRWQLPERPLPPRYLALLAWSGGGDFGNGERCLQLFPIDGPSGVRAMTLAYHLPEYMPGALPFAFNGGGVFYLFDMREPANADGEYPVVAAHAGNLGWATHEECYPPECWPVADDLAQACRGRTNIEELADCVCHTPPTGSAPDLPETADIYVDQVPSDSVATLLQLRKLLAVTWRIGALRDLLAGQPILAVQGGRPYALHRVLEQSAELRPYLFYDADGRLEPVWPMATRASLHRGLWHSRTVSDDSAPPSPGYPGPRADHADTSSLPLRSPGMTDDEIIAAARTAAAARGRNSLADARITRNQAEAEVLLSDPAYARGGGLLVVIDPVTGTVLRVVPQL
ncbi:SMI1/KNR4 family protein [Dactylosporangium sp. NPDC006015]|uniref:SMI1/KNR4 family protein n=1 Tax=Dactylosporangium sp. NPDC006015 TaxID=3154576 RepID=UPI00339EF71F